MSNEKTETVEQPEVAEAGKVGAPTTTPNETIAGMIPETRVSRSAALKTVREAGVKCSQERMTKIMEEKYGAAPSKEERDADRAEVKAKKEAERAEAREAKKAEREAKALEKKEAKEAVAKAKAEAKEASKEVATEAPAV